MKENDEFNKYMVEFKKLPLREKEDIVEKQTKQLLSLIVKLKLDLKVSGSLLYNKEILDMKNRLATPDDFAEAMLVYVTMFQESVAEYADYITNILYKEEI